MSNLTPRIDNLERNYIINGNFDIWQRGNSTVNGSPFYGYAGDRFQVERSTTLTSISLAQSAVVPTLLESGFKSATAAVIFPTSSAYTPVGSEFLTIRHGIEGYNFSNLVGKKSTLSFWVRSEKIGIYTLCVRNASTDGANRIHYLTEYTINVANTWEKKVIIIDFSSDFLAMPTTSYNLTNGLGIEFLWCLAAGPSRKTSTLNTWHNQGGNTFFASTNQVNLLDLSTNAFRISQVQLVEGSDSDPVFSTATKNIGAELALCQRYYQTQAVQQYYGIRYGGTSPYLTIPLPVTMRTSPTTTNSFNTIFVSAGTLNAVVNSNNTSAVLSFQVNTSNTSVDFALNFTYIADAEL